MRRVGIFFTVIAAFVVGLVAGLNYPKKGAQEAPIISELIAKPLEKYSIENLSGIDTTGELKIKEVLEDKDSYTPYLFGLEFNPNLDGKTHKLVTGQINLPAQAGIPKGNKKFPLILMLRGYIDQETYITGDGTRNAAAFFAENGFITVAPDFLGYGASDSEADNIFESRFQTYVTVLSLLKSLSEIEKFNNKDIFIWGHSNGGQIALTALEITGADYPTTLWAPVSKYFPYSVLYYTDASSDRGKLIRSELSKFEELYNPDAYSLDLYLDKINAPLQIHQGTIDDAVPIAWTNQLVEKLESLEKDVTYYTYPATDHNMRPSWDKVIERDLEFFKSHLK